MERTACAAVGSVAIGLLGAWAVEGVAALTGVGATAEARATAHGAMRMAQASRLSAAAAKEVVRGATTRGLQADGAEVFIQLVNGRFNVVVSGERGVITTFKNLSERSLARLARNYGWTFK